MASFERFDDMCDLRLKPKILRNLLSEYVPNEKQPLTNFLSLSKVVSTISTHKLLSESPPASIDQKLHAKSKSAVDDWVARLSALISSDMVPIEIFNYSVFGIKLIYVKGFDFGVNFFLLLL
jgi:hypothetical protein